MTDHYDSQDIAIGHVAMLPSPHSPDNDGVDSFVSHHAVICHVYIDVGDGDVAIESGQPGSPGPDDPWTDITITDAAHPRFNPHPCARGDLGQSLKRYINTMFQSTPLRELREG